MLFRYGEKRDGATLFPGLGPSQKRWRGGGRGPEQHLATLCPVSLETHEQQRALALKVGNLGGRMSASTAAKDAFLRIQKDPN